MHHYVGFINPQGNNFAYTDMFRTINNQYNKMISEMRPIVLSECPQFYITIITAFAVLAFTKTKVRLTDGLFILGFGILSFTTQRNVYYLVIFGGMALTRIIDDCFKEYKIYNIEIKDSTKKVCEIIISSIIILCSLKNFAIQLGNEYENKAFCPEIIANYLIENYNLDEIRLYNGFNEGAYLEFKGIPAFMDSRMEIYIREFNNTDIMEDYANLLDMKVNYNVIFNKYNITHAIVNNKITQYMGKDEKWKMLCQDEDFTLFERVRV